MGKMRFTIRLTKNGPEDAWAFTAQCVEIPGAISEGNTEDEAVHNVVAALHDILDLRRKEAEAEVRTAPPQQGSSLRTVVVDA